MERKEMLATISFGNLHAIDWAVIVLCFLVCTVVGLYFVRRASASTDHYFLTFLGSYWGTGDPRFPDDLVMGWTKHTNNYSGTVTWDVPLNNSGLIPRKHLKQLTALCKYIAVYLEKLNI